MKGSVAKGVMKGSVRVHPIWCLYDDVLDSTNTRHRVAEALACTIIVEVDSLHDGADWCWSAREDGCGAQGLEKGTCERGVPSGMSAG